MRKPSAFVFSPQPFSAPLPLLCFPLLCSRRAGVALSAARVGNTFSGFLLCSSSVLTRLLFSFPNPPVTQRVGGGR